jgi:hypothetical protein
MTTSFESLFQAARPPYRVELLLKVVAGDDRSALAAWQEWRGEHTIADANGAEQRLLSTVGQRLSNLAIDASDKAALASAKRQVWISNQLRLRAHAWIFRRLADAGFPMMLLKGGARIAGDGAMQTRVVRDIDVLFPSEHLSEAIDILIAMGLRSVNGRLPGMVKSQPFAPVRLVEQRPADYLEIDVHSVPLRLGQRGDWDSELWQRGERVEFMGIPVTVPSVSDRYVHAIAHGLVADEDSPADWAVDAFFALRDKRFDPATVAAEIRHRRIGVPLAIGSTYLRDVLNVDVPEIVFEVCRRDVASSLYRQEMAATMVLGRERVAPQRLLVGIAEWFRSASQARPARTWKTAWLLRPSLLTPKATWAPFIDGKAELPLQSGMGSRIGRMTVFFSGSDICSVGRSFDLLIDGAWIGRLRVRVVDFLRPLSLHTLRATFRYRLPSALVRPGPARLTVVALDDQKMPSNRPLPGIRVAAEITGGNPPIQLTD